MDVALIGATGDVGSRILAELVRRGHTVTAVCRNPDKLVPQPGVTTRKGDVLNDTELVGLLKGHDAVISSVSASTTNSAKLIEAVKRADVPRYIVVGGAGSLEITPGRRVLDAPDFPLAWKPGATACAAFLDLLRDENVLNWTFFSPSMNFTPDERTGSFRLGQDMLLTTDQGSHLSFEDGAIAIVAELETLNHPQQRFTAGY